MPLSPNKQDFYPKLCATDTRYLILCGLLEEDAL